MWKFKEIHHGLERWLTAFLWGMVIYWVLSLNKINAQPLEPFVVFGAGMTSMKGSSLTAGAGLNWKGASVIIQHWGCKQWGQKTLIIGKITPNEKCTNFRYYLTSGLQPKK